jgi:ankyrin repeat protein
MSRADDDCSSIGFRRDHDDEDDDDLVMSLQARVLGLELALDRSRKQEHSLRSTIDQLQLALLDSSAASTSDHSPPHASAKLSTSAAADLRERPMLDAAYRGDTMALRMLLQSRRTGTTYFKTTVDDALIVAAESGQLETIRYLLEEAGANVHAGHDSALLWACRNGSLELLEYLVSRGADATALGRCGIALAVAGGHDRVVDRLLQHSSFFAGNS